MMFFIIQCAERFSRICSNGGVYEVLDEHTVYKRERIGRRGRFTAPIADNDFSQPPSGKCCHPERSEGSGSMSSQMLRFAQHDETRLEPAASHVDLSRGEACVGLSPCSQVLRSVRLEYILDSTEYY